MKLLVTLGLCLVMASLPLWVDAGNWIDFAINSQQKDASLSSSTTTVFGSGPISSRSPTPTLIPNPNPIRLLKHRPTQVPMPIPIASSPSASSPSHVEELDTAWKSGSWSGEVHQLEKRPCTAKPFAGAPCGPVTEIRLELVSGSRFLLEEMMDSSMNLDRRAAIGDAIIKRGPEQIPSDIEQSDQKIRSFDAWKVNITVPQIQPGFTGTIGNAHIIVDKAYVDGKPNGRYRAIGPWVGACRLPGYYPAIGQVTITEFSKTNISGTFSGQLSDETGPECGPPIIARPINESFTLTKIHWGKTLPSPVITDDELIDEQVDDVNEVLPGLIGEEMRDFIKDKARKKRQKQQQRKQRRAQRQAQQKAQGKLFKKCDCQCQLEASYCSVHPQSKCCQICDPMYRMCKNLGPKTYSDPAQEAAEVQAMRKTYQDYLEFKVPQKASQNAMLKHFDSLTTQQKRMLMMGVPQKP